MIRRDEAVTEQSLIMKNKDDKGDKPERRRRDEDAGFTPGDALRIFLCFHAVCLLWIFFRAETPADALAVLNAVRTLPFGMGKTGLARLLLGSVERGRQVLASLEQDAVGLLERTPYVLRETPAFQAHGVQPKEARRVPCGPAIWWDILRYT